MVKSIYTAEYKLMVRLLRESRERQGLTQEVVAASLGLTASMLSKIELGFRRLDLRELKLYLDACDVDLVEFVQSWQQAILESRAEASEVKLKKGRPVPNRKN